MPTTAQIAAARENAKHSTGPRTPEGKSRSSRNAVKLGLFTAHDFVLPEDQPAYDEVCAAFWQELQPEGATEETLACEIIRASWRLQRCAKAEAHLADQYIAAALRGTMVQTADDEYTRVPYTPGDALQNEAGLKVQAAIDRARGQATNAFRRATADLRRIQTDREAARATAHIAQTPARGLSETRKVAAEVRAAAKRTTLPIVIPTRSVPLSASTPDPDTIRTRPAALPAAA